MKRVLIIGNAGSGKSTFSQKLAKITKLPLVHLDSLYWTGTWEHVDRDTFDRLLQAELEKPAWIIDGNFNRTIPHRLKYCDTVFYFDLPTITCLWGITKRVLTHYGKTRSDMGGNCPERFDTNKAGLYKNVLHFRKEHRQQYKELLASGNHFQTIVFKSRRQAKRFLEQF